jgi:hypothetical protein
LCPSETQDIFAAFGQLIYQLREDIAEFGNTTEQASEPITRSNAVINNTFLWIANP